MKKVITVVLFLLVVLCISTTKVNAKMIESKQVYANNSVNLKPNDNPPPVPLCPWVGPPSEPPWEIKPPKDAPLLKLYWQPKVSLEWYAS